MIRHQFHQVGVDLEQWMRLAASVLARASESAAVVTSLRTDFCRLKHVEFIALHETMALLIVVLEGASSGSRCSHWRSRPAKRL